jgi:hypothetical protein
MTQFKKVELLESLKHLYKGNEIDGEHFKKLKEFIEQSFTPTTAPLTDEERKELEDNDIAFESLDHAEYKDNRDIVFTELVYKKSTLDDITPFIYGIGRTKAEAERDAYNQLKEAKLI